MFFCFQMIYAGMARVIVGTGDEEKKKPSIPFAHAYSTTAGVFRADRITLVLSRNTDLVWNLFVIEPNRKRFRFRLATLAFRYVSNRHVFVFPLLKTHKRKTQTISGRPNGFSVFIQNGICIIDTILLASAVQKTIVTPEFNTICHVNRCTCLYVKYVVSCLICSIAHKRLKIYRDNDKR